MLPPQRTRIALLLSNSMTVMAGAVIAPSLPEMQATLARQPNDPLLVRLVLTLPALLTALFSPVAGWVVDRAGRRTLLLAGIVLYLVAGTTGLYLATLPQLLVGRALLGVAIACIITASVTLVADLFAHQERQRFLGLQSGFMGLSAMVFLSAGGWLAEQHWRAPFAIYGIGLVVLFIAARHIPETRDQVVSRAHATHSEPAPVPWLKVVVVYLCGKLGMMLFYLIPVQLPFYLQSMGADVATQAGFAIGCSTVVGAMTALQYRRFRARLGYRSIFALMFAIVGASFVLLGGAQSYSTTLLSLALGGVGFGLLVPNATVWMSDLAPELARGRLMGGLMTCFFVGQFVSPIVAQPALQAHGLGGSHGVYALAGFMSLVLAVGFVIFGPLWKRVRPS